MFVLNHLDCKRIMFENSLKIVSQKDCSVYLSRKVYNAAMCVRLWL